MDMEDLRSASLAHLMLEVLPALETKPRYLLIENVKCFAESQMHARIVDVLQAHGYSVRDLLLSPTQLGIPNQRTRSFLLARRAPLVFRMEPAEHPALPHDLGEQLDAETAQPEHAPKCLSPLCAAHHRGPLIRSYLEPDIDVTPYLVRPDVVSKHGRLFRLLSQLCCCCCWWLVRHVVEVLMDRHCGA